MKEEWINLLDEPLTEYTRAHLQIEVPCYFDCNDDGEAYTAWVRDKYVDGKNFNSYYSFPIDLTNKNRKWKWKFDETNQDHWEDMHSWMLKHQNMLVPDNYHYYRKRKTNDFRTFGKEHPMNGTAIILQFEVRGNIYKDEEGYWVEPHGPNFMFDGCTVPKKLHVEQENFVVKRER